MAIYIEKTKARTLPLLALRGAVAFPSIPFTIEAGKAEDIRALEAAHLGDETIFLVGLDPSAESDETLIENLYRVGTVATIKKFVRLTSGALRVQLDCLCRGELTAMADAAYPAARVIFKTVQSDGEEGREQTLRADVLAKFDRFIRLLPEFNKELESTIKHLENSGQMADLIAGSVLIRLEHKQQILEEFDPIARLELLSAIFDKEIAILKQELDIHKKTRARIEENQRDYYLREQLKVIRSELGEDEDEDDDIYEYVHKILTLPIPEEIAQRLLKEAHKLTKIPAVSPEANVIRGYLDACLELPWGKSTTDRLDIEAARKILDKDHDGMETIKERILEYIAVRARTDSLKNQIICLVGAPGVGKTSVASSIAKALHRKFVRVSLGGVRDEADIRGHRKTYVASMPGRIIDALTRAQSCNPLILLDEIDKLTRDAHGDPSAALLEVLDPDQNKNFRDHFLEFPFDLSDCIFIATANTLDTISRPLLDRMEIIELKSYSRSEKLSIAKNHLLPKQMKRHGLNGRQLRVEDQAITEVIDGYTREAGVRNLERELATICRKVDKKLLENPEKKRYSIKKSDIAAYLGPRKIIDDKLPEVDSVGLVNGLAYTEAGGDLLQVEALPMPGSGKLEITGSLGDVMKESSKIAWSIVRSKAEQYGIDKEYYKNTDVHIHFPEGAVPKDGPSAGVTMVTVLISALAGIPVRRDVAMTGEVSLRGRVIAIGGLREKSMAAYKAGVKTVLVPEDNRQDYEKLDAFLKEGMTYIFCKNVDDVLANALAEPAETVEVSATPTILTVPPVKGGKNENQYKQSNP